MLNSQSVIESEDSFSDEYIVVEEVHTGEEALTESCVGLKTSALNKEACDDYTTALDDDLRSRAHVITKSSLREASNSPCGLDDEIHLSPAENSKSETSDSTDHTSTIEEVNNVEKVTDTIGQLSSKNGKVKTIFVCNGTIIHKISENIPNEKSCSANTNEEITFNFTNGCNYNEKINTKLNVNGISPSSEDTIVSSSENSSDYLCTNASKNVSSPENIIENNEIAKESCANTSKSRKRSFKAYDIDSSAYIKNCDDEVVNSVPEIKKCKLRDSNSNVADNSSNSPTSEVVENITSCEYSFENKRVISASSSHEEVSPVTHKNSNMSSTTSKKRVARKHTSSINAMKAMKDLRSTVLAEIYKHEENECIQDENSNKRHEDDDSEVGCQNSTVENKVNFSLDSLSGHNLKNIFKAMKRTLTRRQLEEIVLQKVCEMISESNEIGELKKQVLELQQAETHRKLTCFNLEKQIHQLKGVCQVFIDKANTAKKDGRTCTPTMITRSVGLQVNRDSYSTSSRSVLNSAPSQIKHTKTTETKPPSTLNSDDGTSTSSDVPSNVTAPNIAKLPEEERSSPSPNTETKSSSVDDSPMIDLTDTEDKNEESSNFLNSSTSSILSIQPLPTTTEILPGSGNLKPILIRPIQITRHPAPLPKTTIYSSIRSLPYPPPKPELSISRNNDGISLSWNMVVSENCAKIAQYQIYAYQETNSPVISDPWKPVGEVNALPLPMECTLTQFFRGYRYHFTVRAVDELQRKGPFSEASSIFL